MTSEPPAAGSDDLPPRSADYPGHRMAPGDRPIRPGLDGGFTADDDQGLTRERTFLAWNRTALALVTFGSISYRLLDGARPEALRWLVFLSSGALAGSAYLAGRNRYASSFWQPMHAGRRTPRGIRVFSVGLTFVAALTGLAVLTVP